jgi:hypothetical protein
MLKATLRCDFSSGISDDGCYRSHRVFHRQLGTCGQVGLPKSKASKGPVPHHPLLADFMLLWKQKTTYSQPVDWVFPSTRLNGKQPRVANMLVEDLRPAAVKAGILSSHSDNHGRLVDDDPRRFGFHNLRRSLAFISHPDQNRSKDYANAASPQRRQADDSVLHHADSRDRNVAAGQMLTAILSHAPDKNELTAD